MLSITISNVSCNEIITVNRRFINKRIDDEGFNYNKVNQQARACGTIKRRLTGYSLFHSNLASLF